MLFWTEGSHLQQSGCPEAQGPLCVCSLGGLNTHHPNPTPPHLKGTSVCAHLHNLTYSSWPGTVSQCLPLSDVSLSQIAPSYLCLNMLKAPNF